jgi:hypothetical protein
MPRPARDADNPAALPHYVRGSLVFFPEES